MKRVAAVQMASGPNVDANLNEAAKSIDDAVKAGAKLVVLPENFGFMGNHESDIVKIAEEAGSGKIQTFLSEQAEKHGIWLVGGTVPIKVENSNKVRAACIVYNDKGEQAGRYDKIHLFDVEIID
ncbi:MAG: nitrilase-related carbon-nitrogen hydrolase, partial [Gammaproteobacteria bacterium]|nr:nitrilase-related carbon-nitrogen hydrolase [Gammaproteobacteria bacterium]